MGRPAAVGSGGAFRNRAAPGSHRGASLRTRTTRGYLKRRTTRARRRNARTERACRKNTRTERARRRNARTTRSCRRNTRTERACRKNTRTEVAYRSYGWQNANTHTQQAMPALELLFLEASRVPHTPAAARGCPIWLPRHAAGTRPVRRWCGGAHLSWFFARVAAISATTARAARRGSSAERMGRPTTMWLAPREMAWAGVTTRFWSW